MGLCMPKECTQEIYDRVATGMIAPVNNYLKYLADYYNHPVLHGAYVREWTRVGMSLTKSDDYRDDWLSRTEGGVIPTSILLCSILLFVIAINAVKYFRYKVNALELKEREAKMSNGNLLTMSSQTANPYTP
jgi:hypothetical protein